MLPPFEKAVGESIRVGPRDTTDLFNMMPRSKLDGFFLSVVFDSFQSVVPPFEKAVGESIRVGSRDTTDLFDMMPLEVGRFFPSVGLDFFQSVTIQGEGEGY